jgi:ESF2/ABP1 family protein
MTADDSDSNSEHLSGDLESLEEASGDKDEIEERGSMESDEESSEGVSDADANDDDEDEVNDDQSKDHFTNNDNNNDSEQKKPRKIHKLSLEKTQDFNEQLNQRGVLYIARVPPRMTPTKIKTLLSDLGQVTRVYLVEEDAAVRKRRRKVSGNASKRYTEGWVEMADKKIAKNAALTLNNTQMSNVKRNPHYGDLWCIKYLRSFKWSHLTEKVAYERRVREQKLRLETMQARKETQAYKHLVETGKKLDKIEERKRRREERTGVKEDERPRKQSRNVEFEQRAKKLAKKEKDRPINQALLGALV